MAHQTSAIVRKQSTARPIGRLMDVFSAVARDCW